jgi:hypothetical protein
MNQPFLLPGDSSTSGVHNQLSRSSGFSKWLRAFVLVWLLGGVALLAIRLQPVKTKPSEATAVPVRNARTAISLEDLLHHMEATSRVLDTAAQKVRRLQDQIDRALPSMERNYLLVEKHRLESAVAISESARRDLEECRQQFDLILNSLKKEHELE